MATGLTLRAGVNNDAYVQVNGVDVLKIDASGNVTVCGNLSAIAGMALTGALDIAANLNVNGLLTAKQGIKFPAVQVPSADPNTLDDYEEGTWTPVSNQGVFGSPSGYYVKVGGMCWISGFVTFPNLPGNGVAPQCTGLPFVPLAPGSIAIGYTSAPGGKLTSILATNTLNFYKQAGFANFGDLSNAQVYFSGCYACA